jgi:hypothetical protein
VNRFHSDEALDNILGNMTDVPEMYLVNMHGDTKSLTFIELKRLLGIDESKIFSKCEKVLDNLCDDLGAKLNIRVRYSKHSMWVWFNFFGEFKGYREGINKKTKEEDKERMRLYKENRAKEQALFSESIADGTYGINSKDKGGVYLLSCGDFYKIGLSEDIAKRLSNIRTSNPTPVELIAKYSCFDRNYRKLEELLHLKFKDSRHHLEWFKKDFTKEDFLQACIEFCKRPKR